MTTHLIPKPRSRIYRICVRNGSWVTFWRHRGLESREELVLGPRTLGQALHFIAESCRCRGFMELSLQKDRSVLVVATALSWAHTGTARQLCAESEG